MEKYDFREVIGHGNYGTCHLVVHRRERRPYVAKKIPVHKMRERGEALAEAQLLSKLKHPNIIAYKESFLDPRSEYLCIVTAYAEEGDLFTHIRNARELARPFAERQVLDWVAQIALALDHIHALRVMHRDLKTQNIFLGRGGVVKLGDFGISRVLERTDDFATTVAGTPYYLSPEVCQNQPYNLKSDVWSFGCVAYEIATLRHAFAADSLLSLVYQIVNGTCPPVPADRYDARFGRLVTRMLERDSAKRPSVTEILRADVMQEHLRKMQTEGLGRPRSAHVGAGGGAGGDGGGARRAAEVLRAESRSPRGSGAAGRGEIDSLPESKGSLPESSAPPRPSPRERMAERRRLAAEAREAVLREAAAEQKDVSREAFRKQFHGGATRGGFEEGPEASSGAGSEEVEEEEEEEEARDPALGWEDEVAEFALRDSREARGADSAGPLGFDPELGTFSNGGGSLSGHSAFLPVTSESGGEFDGEFDGERERERERERAPERPPIPFVGFSPPRANGSAASGALALDPFLGGASSEACFAPPSRAAPRRSSYGDEGFASSGDAVLLGTLPSNDSAPPSNGASENYAETFVSSAAAEAEILAALTLDAEADVRADAEASLVAAFAARHAPGVGGGGGAGGDAAAAAKRARSPSSRDRALPPPETREANGAFSVAAAAREGEASGAGAGAGATDGYEMDTFEAYDSAEDTAEMLAVAAGSLAGGRNRSVGNEDALLGDETAPDRTSFVVGVESSSSSASPAADATPLTPPVSADASVVAARANKVARLRAACRAQLGAAFEPVHAFLKSAERRRLGDAEARARLLDIARGDETKLAACFAVDMLCFEEQYLFAELEEVRPKGTYAPGVGYLEGDPGGGAPGADNRAPTARSAAKEGNEGKNAGGGRSSAKAASRRTTPRKAGRESPTRTRRIALPGA